MPFLRVLSCASSVGVVLIFLYIFQSFLLLVKTKKKKKKERKKTSIGSKFDFVIGKRGGKSKWEFTKVC